MRFEFNRLNALSAIIPSVLASHLTGVVIRHMLSTGYLSPRCMDSYMEGYPVESYRKV